MVQLVVLHVEHGLVKELDLSGWMMYSVQQVMRHSRSVVLMGGEFITVDIVKMPVSSVKVQSISLNL